MNEKFCEMMLMDVGGIGKCQTKEQQDWLIYLEWEFSKKYQSNV